MIFGFRVADSAGKKDLLDYSDRETPAEDPIAEQIKRAKIDWLNQMTDFWQKIEMKGSSLQNETDNRTS